jgi:alpha-beta hydrolase superfamily lysophospholipase
VPEPETIAMRAADGTALAGLLWEAPAGTPGVLIVPGLGSRKENHTDIGELLSRAGMAALALDLRGHGESGGELDAGCLDDVRAGLDALAGRGHRGLGLRGSSMGGMLALLAAAADRRVRCVVAICPARPPDLAERLGAAWPRRFALTDAMSGPGRVARGFWHATGDEAVPWTHSFTLSLLCAPPVRLRVKMRGGHRTLQHDPAVLRETVAFLAEHLR